MKLLKRLYCILKGCDEIVNGYPIIRDKDNPAICYVTDPSLNLWGFWDKNHPNYKLRIRSILEKANHIKYEDI